MEGHLADVVLLKFEVKLGLLIFVTWKYVHRFCLIAFDVIINDWFDF